MQSPRSRLIFDVTLIAAIALLSFLPAFAAAATSLRVLAGIYTLLALANTIMGDHARVALDLTFALFVASMAWFETMPANNHAREAAVYAATAGIVSVSATRRTPMAPVSIQELA